MQATSRFKTVIIKQTFDKVFLLLEYLFESTMSARIVLKVKIVKSMECAFIGMDIQQINIQIIPGLQFPLVRQTRTCKNTYRHGEKERGFLLANRNQENYINAYPAKSRLSKTSLRIIFPSLNMTTYPM